MFLGKIYDIISVKAIQTPATAEKHAHKRKMTRICATAPYSARDILYIVQEMSR